MSAVVPARYDGGLVGPFRAAIAPHLVPGAAILDVGSGRRPAIAVEDRPSSCRYVGLDVSGPELGRAPVGSYGETLVADVAGRDFPVLEGFDLAVSWQVLEHVRPMDRALDNLRTSVRAGGTVVALFSGVFSAFGLLNRVIPTSAGVFLMHRLLGREPDSVFPAHYDRCYDSALHRMCSEWSSVEITPLYLGAAYFNFALPLRSAYLRYENWAERAGRRNLATHYLLVGVR